MWLGKCCNHEKLMKTTSQWNYVLYLRFGLPFKTCALVSILNKKIPLWHHWNWRVFDCSMWFHWKKIGLPCLINIHENNILPVKLPTVCMECNERKYCGCSQYEACREIFALMVIFLHFYFFSYNDSVIFSLSNNTFISVVNWFKL